MVVQCPVITSSACRQQIVASICRDADLMASWFHDALVADGATRDLRCDQCGEPRYLAWCAKPTPTACTGTTSAMLPAPFRPGKLISCLLPEALHGKKFRRPELDSCFARGWPRGHCLGTSGLRHFAKANGRRNRKHLLNLPPLLSVGILISNR